MKKIFSFLAAGLLLASCSNDDFEGVKGNEQEVAITIELPSAISSRAQASGQNSALGGVSNMESLNVTFTAALYYGSNPDPIWTGNASTTAAVHAVTFKPTLVVGETYRLVSYAQFDGVATLESQVEAFGINDETQDAYFVTTDIVAEPVMSAVLKRPTGKLRLIANDYAEMKRQLGKDIKNVTVTYEDARYTTFNAKTGLWDTAALAATKEYTQAKTTYGTEKDAAEITVFADYIPVNTQTGEEHVSMVVDVTFTDDTHFTREINIDVPIKRNYLTTLVGDFFTSEMELTLIIDEVFENEEEYNYNELATAFELGGEYKLYNNMTIDKAVVLDGKNLVLDLNGYAITTTDGADAIIVKNGTLTINGDGYVTTEDKTAGYAVIVDGANAKAIINGGTYTIGLDDVAVHGQSSCNSAVYTKNGGTAEINGGLFQVKTTQTIDEVSLTRYLINEKDDNRGTISITGGSYVKFDPANNVAEGEGTNFCAEGYKTVELEEGVYTVVTEGVFYVKNDEELKTALTADVENIEVTLLANASYAISAWDANAMGGASTKTITIDANGFNLDFNQTNSDWNNVVVNNDATLTIKNGSISNSGRNNGPWNRYDINFNCNVVLEDVVSSKAIALKAAAKTAQLTNVTINEAGDNYALWITAQGQKVELNKVTINSAGRGVKIDSQYNEDSAALVTLNVTDSKFTTNKKAAIIVKSAAGANITLSNVDIAGVAADNVNAVWVDEDAAATYDVVTVEGGTKVLEGDLQEVADGVYLVTTAAQMVDFAELVNGGNGLSGKTVKLANDIDLAGIEWAPIGQTGGYSASTYFQGTFDGQGHTIKNLTVTKWEAGTDGGANYASGLFGFIDAAAADIKNVTVDGATVKGSHWCGVIAGYLTGVVENCHVMNAAVECTHANSEACGDKAGAVVGATNGTKGTVKNCTAANSTVKAGRDAGQVVGAAPASQVVDCSATNVTVSATGDCTGANVNNAVIGRVL